VKRYSVSVTDKMAEHLEMASLRTGLSVSLFIRQAIRMHIATGSLSAAAERYLAADMTKLSVEAELPLLPGEKVH